MADRALLVGINDYINVSGLNGCLNDLVSMTTLLTNTFGFQQDGIREIKDRDALKPRLLLDLKWLLSNAQPGDRLVWHYSGHGSQVPDDSASGEENDGLDEIICLADYTLDYTEPNSFLIDKEIKKLFGNLRPGVQLVVVFDSCHSGTATRLPTKFYPNPLKRVWAADEDKVPLVITRSIPSARKGLDVTRVQDVEELMAQTKLQLPRQVNPPNDVADIVKARQARRGPVNRMARGLVNVPQLNHVLVAACKDGQTAADAFIAGASHGAFTYWLFSQPSG